MAFKVFQEKYDALVLEARKARQNASWSVSLGFDKQLRESKVVEALDMDSGNYCKIEKSQINPPTLKGIRAISRGLGLSKEQTTMLESLGFTYHLALFKKKWEQT